MKISRQEDVRANQKARTRAALVEAASGLLRGGTLPTVAEAADKAKVSRATAYRYFPSREALLVEVSNLTPAMAPVEEMLAGFKNHDVEGGLLRLIDKCNQIILTEEVSMRTALRVYLDTWLESHCSGEHAPAVREGRRMRWLDKALKPARREFTEQQWRRLRAALALTLSIEAMIVMKDVCQLGDDEALDVLRWAAAALLRAGRDEARTVVRRRPKPASRS
jgi:AcrR family transcriptional regulator